MAPLFFAGLTFAAAGSVSASPGLWAVAVLSVIAATLVAPGNAVPGTTPLAIAVAAYVSWGVANDFLNFPYTAAGIFHPAFLAAGFVFSRRIDPRARDAARGALLVGMAMLASWALWQSASGQGRALAHFETPNTLASVLNLALAPVLFRIAYGESRRIVLALAVLITAALVCTLSRGGFIALATGVLVTGLLFAMRPPSRAVLCLVGVLAAGIAAGVLMLQMPQWLASRALTPAPGFEALASTLESTLGSRSELYRLAFSAVGERPWLGAGYLGFHALFEAGRASVPSYAPESVTWFVHNDYLQTLVELGLPGFLALATLVAAPFWLAKRARAPETDRLALHAALAGLATMAIHALGDFPFYVPICLLLFGALLGEADKLLWRERPTPLTEPGPARRLVRVGGATMLALLILPPPLAEAAAAYGDRSWRSGKAEPAAYGFELARRIQPRDWRYHWYAAQFWYAQAGQSGKKAAASLADQAFAAAMEANPTDPRPLLGRLATQMRFASLLDRPSSTATLRGWAERALALAPLNPAVRQDTRAALAQLGNRP